jgi:CMP-N-acetylneuraminic acid synthetase
MISDKIIIAALIPMKANSERVPNKNLRLFNGSPLYHAIVKALIKSKYISNIIVNTDSVAIKKDIENNFPFIKIINRHLSLQGDFVSMNSIIESDISVISADYFIQTHSTNPLLTTATLDSSIEFFLNNSIKYDSVFSVTKLKSRFYWENGDPINHNPKELLRTQDLDPIFEENSNFYIFSKESFQKAGSKRIGLKPLMVEVDKLEAIDIDEIQDFTIAELLYKQKVDSL